MNERPAIPTDAADDWLDGLLRADGREHRAQYVDDDGFTARVMAALPAPVTLPAWRKPALAALWAATGLGLAFSLPAAFYDVAHEVMRVVVGQPISLTGLAAGVVALGAATWAGAVLVLRRDD